MGRAGKPAGWVPANSCSTGTKRLPPCSWSWRARFSLSDIRRAAARSFSNAQDQATFPRRPRFFHLAIIATGSPEPAPKFEASRSGNFSLDFARIRNSRRLGQRTWRARSRIHGSAVRSFHSRPSRGGSMRARRTHELIFRGTAHRSAKIGRTIHCAMGERPAPITGMTGIRSL